MVYLRERPTRINYSFQRCWLYKFYIDEPADLANVPDAEHVAPGSDAYCVTTGDVYVFNGSLSWEVL